MSEHGLIQTPRAPIALMACESGRKFGEEVANRLGQKLIPSMETWFAYGEGKVVGTSAVIHEETPGWHHCYHIEDVLSQVIEKINSRGSVTEI